MTSVNQEFSAETIAAAFVDARSRPAVLLDYPGTPPQSLEAAYRVQDLAIDRWRDTISGWKVGRIPDPHAGRLGADRLLGPIFGRFVHSAEEEAMQMPVFGGGFVAVEGEFVIEVGEDAPAGKTEWSLDDARALVASVRAGIEVASSPFPGINDHGPLVTISDFGNNNGLIVGAPIEGLMDQPLTEWICETFVDGKSVGRADASGMPGGPLESFRYALENTARRGRPIKAGCFISTGAVTGVHQVKIDQTAEVRFPQGLSLGCTFVSNVASHAAE